MEKICPRCRGIGWLAKWKEGQALPRGIYPLGTSAKDGVIRCSSCGTEERERWLVTHSGLEPTEYGKTTFDWQFPTFPANGIGGLSLQALRDQRIYAKDVMIKAINDEVGLFTFYGDFGAGKTLALQIVVNEAIRNGVESFYAPFVVILDHLKSLFTAKEETSYFWRRLLDVPVLAIDEVDRFQITAWSRHRLFALMDTRYRRKSSHLTICATNSDPRKELPPGDAIGYLFSRMREGIIAELRGDVRIKG